MKQHKSDILHSSAVLREDSGRELVKTGGDAFSIVSGVLSIIHPDQYDMGRLTHDRIIHSNTSGTTVQEWPSVYSALSIISNRKTPYHRDCHSRMPWYDSLMSIGPYGIAPLYLEPFRFRVNNPAGSLCAFSGMAIRHGVRKCMKSRISFAWYMRENVREGQDVSPAGWMRQEVYSQYVGRNGISINRNNSFT